MKLLDRSRRYHYAASTEENLVRVGQTYFVEQFDSDLICLLYMIFFSWVLLLLKHDIRLLYFYLTTIIFIYTNSVFYVHF